MSDSMLKITTSTVTKLYIEGAKALDPITVFLEDFEPKKGKITVSCWGKSWTAYWGAMWDGLTVGQFFTKLNAQYIIGYFDSQLDGTQFSAKALVKLAEAEILKRRRAGDISEGDARDWFNDAGGLEEAPSIDWIHGAHSELMTNVFGDEWWYGLGSATEPNPEYKYLCRIVAAVQQALRQQPAPALCMGCVEQSSRIRELEHKMDAHKSQPPAPDIEAAAKKMAAVFHYPWEHMPEQGRENMRKNAMAVLAEARRKGGKQ